MISVRANAIIVPTICVFRFRKQTKNDSERNVEFRRSPRGGEGLRIVFTFSTDGVVML